MDNEQILKQMSELVKKVTAPETDREMWLAIQDLENGRPERVIAILKYKPSLVTAKDKHGSSLLHSAANHGSVQVAQALLERGASIGALDAYGQTVLHWASTSEAILYFHEQGIKVDERDESGWTPLYALAREGKIDSIRTLISIGADLNARTSEHDRFNQMGWTPLHIACAKNHREVAQLLIACGADVTATSNNGETVESVCVDASLRSMILSARGEVREIAQQSLFINEFNRMLQWALKHLKRWNINKKWLASDTPYSDIVSEMADLLRHEYFNEWLTEYIEENEGVERALSSFVQVVPRQLFLSNTEIDRMAADVRSRGLLIERWRSAFLLIDSPLKQFLNTPQGPLDRRNLPIHCPCLEAITWLLRQDEFWGLRHSLAHSNFAWQDDQPEPALLAYDKNNAPVKVLASEAEAFFRVTCALSHCLLGALRKRSNQLSPNKEEQNALDHNHSLGKELMEAAAKGDAAKIQDLLLRHR